MSKLVRDGLVAVVYSPGFGAGWSTWNGDELREFLTMDSEIAQAVLDGDNERAARIAAAANGELGYVCVLGADSLCVQWVPEGSAFQIDEYDGNESVHVIGERSYLRA